MNAPSSFSLTRGDHYLFLACAGKGNFMNSPLLRKIADEAIAEGVRTLIVDLSACTGMDSTFMGTLAGLGRRLMSLGGSVQIAEPGEKNTTLLENLGLDLLLEIEPAGAFWRGKIASLRAGLEAVDVNGALLKGQEQAQHVLDAHVLLSDMSESNAQKFKGVVDILKQEIGLEKESGTQGN